MELAEILESECARILSSCDMIWDPGEIPSALAGLSVLVWRMGRHGLTYEETSPFPSATHSPAAEVLLFLVSGVSVCPFNQPHFGGKKELFLSSYRASGTLIDQGLQK